jgi:DNA invertase Pin-like site-specific DNA recombinase
MASKPMLVGYARVSTVDQNLALRRDTLTEAGCGKIYTEQMSGAVADRPALHDALEFAHSGNTLIVWKLSNLELLHWSEATIRIAQRSKIA